MSGGTIPIDLLALVDLADSDPIQAFFPDFDDDGALQLQQGEQVLFEFETNRVGFGLDVSPLRHDNGVMHDLDGKCVVTNCRLVFFCKKWNTSPELGRLGKASLSYIDSLALESVVNIVNKVRARRDRKGVLLGGQVREGLTT